MNETMLTIPEFCQLAKIGRTRLYALLATGELKAVKFGKKTLIKRSDVNTWIASLNPYKPAKSGHENK